MSYHSRIIALLACLVLVAVVPNARGEDAPELLSVARDRHRAAREAIRSLSADVVIDVIAPENKRWMSGKYWRSSSTVRVQDYPPGTDTVEDHVLQAGEIRSVGRHRVGEGRYDRYGTGRDTAAHLLGMCDVWREMLIDYFDPTQARHDYDRFLELAKKRPKAVREKLNGIECIRVSMAVPFGGDEWSYTFWHDIDHNYLIRKVILDFGKGSEISEWEIAEFTEAKPGVFVPLICRLKVFHDGKLHQELLTTLSNVKVNEPIAKDVFSLPPIPAGTVLHDKIEGKRYPIDGN